MKKVRMKGAILTTRQIIELIFVVVLVGAFLFIGIEKVWALIQKAVLGPLSGEVIPTGTEEATSLEAAIKCSYLRCLDGCGKESIKNLQISSTKNCDTDYCVPYQKDGKVCGDDAKTNPVKVTLANNQVISREKLKTAATGDLGACMVKSDSCNAQFAMKGWVNIQKEVIVEKQWEKTNCPYIRTQVEGFDKVVVSAEKYEVWTTPGAGLLGGFTTVVCEGK
jgi:hypothetical protein